MDALADAVEVKETLDPTYAFTDTGCCSTIGGSAPAEPLTAKIAKRPPLVFVFSRYMLVIGLIVSDRTTSFWSSRGLLLFTPPYWAVSTATRPLATKAKGTLLLNQSFTVSVFVSEVPPWWLITMLTMTGPLPAEPRNDNPLKAAGVVSVMVALVIEAGVPI